MFQLLGDYTPQPPWDGPLKGAGEEGLAVHQTSDSRGAIKCPVSMEHWTSSIPIVRVLEGAGQFALPVFMDFVDMRRLMTASLKVSCGGFCPRVEGR